MNRILVEGCFVLAVLAAVVWLRSIVGLAFFSIFGGMGSERLRENLLFYAIGGELPVFLFGWLYCQLSRGNASTRPCSNKLPPEPQRPASTVVHENRYGNVNRRA